MTASFLVLAVLAWLFLVPWVRALGTERALPLSRMIGSSSARSRSSLDCVARISAAFFFRQVFKASTR